MRRSLWWMMGPLRDAAGSDGADGGGGGGAGGGEPFDPAKFRQEIMSEFTRQINGVASRLEKALKPPAQSAPPAGGGGDDGGGDDGNRGGDPKPTSKDARELARLRADLESEKKRREETESRARESNRIGTLRAELGKHVDPKKLEAAVKIFKDDVKVLEDGTIVAGPDEVPISDFIAETIQGHEYLLPPKPVGGAGAAPGGQRGAKVWTVDDIKPGMSPETKREIWRAIQLASGQ